MGASIPIIGIRGDMGAGKDTLADEIGRWCPGYATRKFADKLREAASVILVIPANETSSDAGKKVDLSDRRFSAPTLVSRIREAITLVTGRPGSRDIAAAFFKILTGAEVDSDPWVTIPMTVGRFLQVLGTECFRTHISPNVWVDALLNPWVQAGCAPIVVADTRFPEESAAIRRAGGVVVLVRRKVGARADGRSTRHASERALDDEEADVVFDNDGTIAALMDAFIATWPILVDLAARRQAEKI